MKSKSGLLSWARYILNAESLKNQLLVLRKCSFLCFMFVESYRADLVHELMAEDALLSVYARLNSVDKELHDT